MKKIEIDNIFLILKNISSIKTSKQKEKSLQFFLNTKIVDESSQVFENDFINIVQIENIVLRAQINFFDTNNLDQNLMTAIETKDHSKLLKIKISRVQELNRFKNQFRADESFHLQKMLSNVKKIESFKK